MIDLLLQKDPKLRPQAAKILILPISELKMSDYVVQNLENGKYEGQYKNGNLNGYGVFYRADGSRYEG